MEEISTLEDRTQIQGLRASLSGRRRVVTGRGATGSTKPLEATGIAPALATSQRRNLRLNGER